MNNLNRNIECGEVIVISKEVFPEHSLYDRTLIVIYGGGLWKNHPEEKLVGHWASTGTRVEDVPGTCIDIEETVLIQSELGSSPSYTEIEAWWKAYRRGEE